MKLKLTKVSGKQGAQLGPSYWATGFAPKDFDGPRSGLAIVIFKPIETIRNEHFDYFRTTEIKSWFEMNNGWEITTQNSVWLVERV